MDGNGEIGFHSLPENCIADVLARTTPRDACHLSFVAKIFNSAAESDAVWEKFLPSDYRDIIARSIKPLSVPDFSSTKQLYLHLSDHPLIIDGGNKSFSLEKRSGKKCYMLAARNLTIAWSDIPHYWTWTLLPDSRFEEVAELKGNRRLEINGIISTSHLSHGTKYAAYLVYKLTDNACGFQITNYCHGDLILPPEVFVGLIGDESKARCAVLGPENSRWRFDCVIYPEVREDGWLEVELGEFYNNGVEDMELKMSLKEVKVLKRGLIVQGIEIRPKEPRVFKNA